MSIEAKVIADSISPQDIRLTTLQLRYPRFIHSEVMTHRMFSRNASSSRAIPVAKTIEEVMDNPAMPIHWGKNQPGMQAREELTGDNLSEAKGEWIAATMNAANSSEFMLEEGVHKQIANRILEPFQHISVIVTATEWDNFFKLRLHPDAQPEIQELARVMKEAMDDSNPLPLLPGEWHLPYIGFSDYKTVTGMAHQDGIDYLETLRLISAARCARVSYNNHDGSEPDIGKDLKLAKKLAESGHWSPFEHIATPMKCVKDVWSDKGQTHMDRAGWLWSANFKGWVQYRHSLEMEG